MKEFIKKI